MLSKYVAVERLSNLYSSPCGLDRFHVVVISVATQIGVKVTPYISTQLDAK